MKNFPVVNLFPLSLMLLVVGVLLGNLPLVAGAGFLILTLGMSITLRARNVIVTRSLEKGAVWVGEPLKVNWQIQLGRSWGATMIREPWPHVCQLDVGTNTRIVTQGLLHASTISHDYSVQFRRRGEFTIVHPSCETLDPLALWPPHLGKVTPDELSVFVSPKLVPLRNVPFILGNKNTNTKHGRYERTVFGTITEDFRDIREYRPGDSLRLINWKATAKTRTSLHSPPMVNVHEQETVTAAWIFLDASEYMLAGGTNVDNSLEYAIAAANSIASVYLSRGYSVGAHTSANPQQIIHADYGAKQHYDLTRWLTNLTSRYNYYNLADTVLLNKRELLKLPFRYYIVTRLNAFSPTPNGALPRAYQYLRRGIIELLRLQAKPGRSNTTIISIAPEPAPSIEQSAEVMLATQLLRLTGRENLRQMSSTGAHILEWSPGSYSLELVLTKLMMSSG